MKFKNFLSDINKLDIIVISDTHNAVVDITDRAEVIVHCGDYCDNGTKEEFLNFVEWYSKVPIQYKILSPGNHDWQDPECSKICAENNIIYLEDTATIIKGVKFYGAPWTEFCDTRNFDIEENEVYSDKWNLIHDDTDVLLTHSPSYGIRDKQKDREELHIGSPSLTTRINELPNLKAHFFGHVHGPSGITKDNIIRVNGAYDVNKVYYKVAI